MKNALLWALFIASLHSASAAHAQSLIGNSTADRITYVLDLNKGKIEGDFLLVDKIEGRIYRVSKEGEILNESNALVGLERKDIPNMKLYYENPKLGTRITPAGAFQIKRYLSTKYGRVISFIEGPKAATAIHHVYLGNPKERRDQRILSSNPNDRRITFGCINVPEEFLDAVWDLKDGTHLFVLPEKAQTHDQFRNILSLTDKQNAN